MRFLFLALNRSKLRAKSFRQDAPKVIDRDMLNTCFLKKGWLLAFLWSLQFYFGAFSKCSSRSLCSDRKSNSNGLLIYVSFVQSSVVHIAPSGYVITFELLINPFPF